MLMHATCTMKVRKVYSRCEKSEYLKIYKIDIFMKWEYLMTTFWICGHQIDCRFLSLESFSFIYDSDTNSLYFYTPFRKIVFQTLKYYVLFKIAKLFC